MIKFIIVVVCLIETNVVDERDMMKTDVKDGREKVMLIFTKNQDGEYVYSYPVVAKYDDSNWRNASERMIISRGKRKGESISLSSCLDSDGLLGLVSNFYHENIIDIITLNEISQFDDSSDCIAIVIDPTFERFIENNSYGEEYLEYLSELVMLVDLIGWLLEKTDGDSFSINVSSDKAMMKVKSNFNAIADAIMDKFEMSSSPTSNNLESNNTSPQIQTTSKPSFVQTLNSLTQTISEEELVPINSLKRNSDDIISDSIVDRRTLLEEIKKKVKDKVIGQDDAVDVVVYNILSNQIKIARDDPEINLLFLFMFLLVQERLLLLELWQVN